MKTGTLENSSGQSAYTAVPSKIYQAYTNTYAELYNINFIWVPLISLPVTVDTNNNLLLCRFSASFRARVIHGPTNVQKVSFRIQVDGSTILSWTVSQTTQSALEWAMANMERVSSPLSDGAHTITVDWGSDALSDPNYKGTWDNVTSYVIGDIVYQNGLDTYVAIADNTNEEPSTHPGSWAFDGASNVAQTEMNDGGDFFGNGAVLTVQEVQP